MPQILFRFLQNDGPYLFTTYHHASQYCNLYGFYNKLGKHGKLLRFVYHASLYNLVNKANLVHNLFPVYLFINLYMFRVTTGPSSGETAVWYAGWNESLSTLHTRQSFTQNNKYQVSRKCSCLCL